MSAPTEIIISNSGFEFDGMTYSTSSSFTSALIAKRITRVHMLPKKDAKFQQVQAAMQAAFDAGVTDFGIIGNVQNE